MSTPNGDSCKEHEGKVTKNIFTPFPEVIDDKINTKQFLTAARGVVRLIEKFGKLFAPVKYDMQGNIEKLSAKYLVNKEVNATLQDMILLEVAIGDSMVATDALLWLTRGLHMIQLFFEKIIDDWKSGQSTEDLGAILRQSYVESLEPYHGWMAKQLFALVSRTVPNRTLLLQGLANNVPGEEELTLQAMDVFVIRLKDIVTNIQAVYYVNNLPR